MLIDTHCHLDAAEFAGERDDIVLAAQQCGVTAIVVPAVEPGNFSRVRDCCARYPGVFPAYGFHPLYLDRVGADDLTRLRDWLASERQGPFAPLAVGEIGLDHFVPGFDAARQEYFLGEQLGIARDFDLPVLLHVRRAVDQVLKCVRRSGVRAGIAHAFNGSVQQANAFLDLGFKLGFGGAMTHAGSTRIRQLAATLPITAIVLETDAPDIPPAWLAGGRNAPGELARIAGVLAELRAVPVAQVLQATSENARSVFRGAAF
jgi:TatD DNase family protein